MGNTGGTIEVRGLNPLTTYGDIVVKVYDNAGNETQIGIQSTTTLGRLLAPTLTVAEPTTKGPGTDGNYYNANVKINIKDNAGSQTGAERIELTITKNGTEAVEIRNWAGTNTTYDITQEGRYQIVARMRNKIGEAKSDPSNVLTFVIDKTKPTVTLAEGAAPTTSKVEVKATASDNLSGIYSYNYKWNFTGSNTEWIGHYDPQVTSATSHVAGFTIGPGSKIWIGVTVTDKAGNESYMSNGFWLWTKANKPVIQHYDGSWAQERECWIQGIANHKIKYTDDNSDPRTSGTAKTLSEGTDKKYFKIKKENCKVRAVYVNTVTGQVNSEIGEAQITKIDITLPTTAKLTKGTVTSNSIEVTAEGADAAGGSGVWMYVYEISQNNKDFSIVGQTSAAGNTPLGGKDTYTYTGLAPNTTYYVRVTVTDFAENEKKSDSLTVKTTIAAPTYTISDVDTWTREKTLTIPEQPIPDRMLCGCLYDLP